MKQLPPEQLEFAAVIAHQLKSPIVAVSAMLQNILGEFAGPVTPKQKEVLEKSLFRCKESLDTAQRLLAIAKATQDPAGFKGKSDLNRIVRQITQNYEDQAAKRSINLITDINPNSTAMASALESAITEVIEALINNALKYTPDNGTIGVSVTLDPEDNTYQVRVSDSGIGIPPEDIEKLFTPFFRTTTAKDSSRPGTGLGLAFVKAIVTAAGGTISVEKADLGGAEFVISLPACEEDAEEDKKGPKFKVVIIGGVASGPKVAAKIMRLEPDAEVTIVEKEEFLSYAGCGFPYYISGIVSDQKQLMSTPVGVVRDPVFFQKVKNIHIMSRTEALEIDRQNKRVLVKQHIEKKQSWLQYDKLVIATGAMPTVPRIEGVELENIYTLHGVTDAEGIRAALDRTRARDVAIVGGGLIGIEMTEALARKGCRVTIVEAKNQIMPMLDWEIARLIERHLESKGVRVLTDTTAQAFEGKNNRVHSILTDRGKFPADLVIIATGLNPNVTLAQKADLEIGQTGAIKVNPQMQTSDPDIYAAGDCVQNTALLTGKPIYMPLGSTANKQGRIVARNICGAEETFPGILSTIACKVFDYSVAMTGLTEKRAKQLHMDIVTVLAPGPDREHFVPGAQTVMLKLVVDRKNRKLLGAQAAGPGDCVKRIDVAAMAITANMSVDTLANVDLSYAPPYSPVIDNIMTAANVARNKLDDIFESLTPMQVQDKIQAGEDFVMLDVRNPHEYQKIHLPGSILIPLASLRGRMRELPKEKLIVTFCNVSLRGYEAALILKKAGFQNVAVMDGGLEMWPYEKIQ